MAGALLVAVVASIGNLLQGWDNATIAGAVLYIKKEFKLESEPTVEGLIIAMSLIGATIITMFSGAVSDRVGRRPLLIVSSIFYFVSGLIMLWSPNVYVLLLARLIDGFGIGLAVTLVPVYISETAPSEIRGSLNTLPQFSGCGGMFLSYCMLFGMSLMPKPDWRIMLGVLSVPSLLYFSLTIFYLPESPRWLVSKGRMVEAKQVLQKLRGREDVSGEMALLVEGLGVGGDTSIEEYIIGPANELCDEQGASNRKEQMTLYGSEDGIFWNAQPFKGQCALGNLSRSGMANQSVPFMDPLVTLFGTVHEKPPEMISILGVAEQQHPETTEWDEESLQKGNKDYESDDDDEFDDDDDDESDNSDDLRSPLLSAETTRIEEKDTDRGSSLMQRNSGGEVVSGIDIGGGWKLAWTWSEIEKERDFKRLYLHQEGASGSLRGEIPEEGQYIHAAALVSDPALHSKNFLDLHKVGPAVVHPSEALAKCPRWKDLLEPGVRHALLVGIGIQILQQFAGINGVLYYTPQILKQAGVEVLLANIGVSSDSASILTSGVTTLLMIPAIGIAMRLMDISGRRSLLLFTIPCLIASLIVLVVANLVEMGMMVHAVLSTVSVITYFCCFVMGFGPIPNILCAEIFPTRVRGMCIAVCALTFWFGDIIVTYSLPLMLNSIGLAGVFGIYAVVCVIAFIFVFLEVPETKGMPLEVIAEFFAVGSVSVRIPNHENSESTIDIN